MSVRDNYGLIFVGTYAGLFLYALNKTRTEYSIINGDRDKYLKLVTLNFSVIMLLLAGVMGSKWFKNLLSWSPNFVEIISQAILIAILDDMYFYFTHKLMHRIDSLRNNIHYVHHTNLEPIPLDYQHSHPIETLVMGGSYFLLVAIFYLFGYQINAYSLYLAYIFRIMHEIRVHGTNNIHEKAIIPCINSPKEHIKHHLAFSQKSSYGNYASLLPFWDWLMGTQISDDVLVDQFMDKN